MERCFCCCCVWSFKQDFGKFAVSTNVTARPYPEFKALIIAFLCQRTFACTVKSTVHRKALWPKFQKTLHKFFQIFFSECVRLRRSLLTHFLSVVVILIAPHAYLPTYLAGIKSTTNTTELAWRGGGGEGS